MEELLKNIPVKELIQSAIEARKKAYAPYSGYMVGAAVLTAELRIYTVCNIENASYTPSVCAERTAISKAVSEGARKILAVAVAGSPQGELITQYAYPCGVCRQVFAEFCDSEMPIICANENGRYQIYSMGEILPYAFNGEHLK